MIWAMRLDCCPKSTLCSPCVCLIDFPLYDTACRCEFPYCLLLPAICPPPPNLYTQTLTRNKTTMMRTHPYGTRTVLAKSTTFYFEQDWGVASWEALWMLLDLWQLIMGQIVRGFEVKKCRRCHLFVWFSQWLAIRGCRCFARPD